MYTIHRIVVTDVEANCYVLHHGSKALVIDPGGNADVILAYLEKHRLSVEIILNTHGHADHICANAALKRAVGAPIAVHEQDAMMLTSHLLCGAYFLGWEFEPQPPDIMLNPREPLATSFVTFNVLHTPGHSFGSCCFLDRTNGILFSGDLIFQGSVGRWDLPGGDQATLFSSLREAILPLDDKITIYPGHGPHTTIAIERQTNPYLHSLLKM